MKNGIVVNSWTVLHVALLLVTLTPGFNSTKLHLGNKSCDAHTISPLQGIPHFGSIDCVMMTFDLSRPCYRRGDWRRRREIVWRRRPRRIHRIDRQLPRCLGRAQGLFATYFHSLNVLMIIEFQWQKTGDCVSDRNLSYQRLNQIGSSPDASHVKQLCEYGIISLDN